MPKSRSRKKPTKSTGEARLRDVAAPQRPWWRWLRYTTGRVVSTSDQIGGLWSGENVKPDLMVELLFLSRPAQVRDLVLDL